MKIFNNQYGKANDFFRVSRIEKIFVMIFFVGLLLIWSVPVYSLVMNSLKVNGIKNYTYVLSNRINDVPFYRYFVNSGINAIGSSSLVVLVSVMAGFAFSKIKFAGRSLIFSFSVMCLAISGPVLIIPFFYILKNLNLYNTPWAIILCEATITIPFGLLMMKNFYDGLPEALMESASIDGASIIQCFTYIYLPLAKPALINLAVLQFMWSLQDFLFPLMFLTNEELYTTTVAVNSFQGAYGMSPQNLGRYNAALVLIALPTIIIFSLVQKYIINGVVSGAIKG